MSLAVWLHLAAAALWIACLLRALLREGEGPFTPDWRWATIATVALLASGGTGFWAAVGPLRAGENLFLSPFGQGVLLKGFVFSVSCAIQTMVVAKIVPTLRAASAEGNAAVEAQARGLFRGAVVVALAMTVIGVAAGAVLFHRP